MNNGVIGETATIHHLTKLGYDVFIPVNGTQPLYDLVADLDGKLYKVSVKSTSVKTSSGRWLVNLRRIRINRGKNNIHLFDNTTCDLVAIYIIPEDRVLLIDARTITVQTALTVD